MEKELKFSKREYNSANNCVNGGGLMTKDMEKVDG
jgi:hypothetical protein